MKSYFLSYLLLQLPLLAFGGGYNDTCGIDSDCIPPVLKCELNICTCPRNDTGGVIWDYSAQMCFLLEGQSCVINPSLNDPKCIGSALCAKVDGDPVCVCNHGLKPNIENRCYLEEGDTCDRKHDMCNPLNFLHCALENKCECLNDGAVFSNTCVLLPGAYCELDSFPFCMDGNAKTDCNATTKTCPCDEPDTEIYPEDPTQCYFPYETACSSAPYKCNPYRFHDCLNNLCLCEGGNSSSVYDKKTDRCYKLAGEKCDNNSMPCIHSATCLQNNGTGICTCSKNTIPNTDKMCKLGYDQSCQVHNDMCDPLQFLSCSQENLCRCKDSGAVYDYSSMNCYLTPDSECSISTNTAPCIKGTRCQYNIVTKKWSCTCSYPESERSKDDPTKCFLSHSKTCDSENLFGKCDPYVHLECIEGQCLCQGENLTSVYDNKTETCLRLAMEYCDISQFTPGADIYGEMSCIRSAFCKIDGEDRPTCMCKHPLSKGIDNFCYLQLGQDCSTLNEKCDPNKFLSCNLENKCSCYFDSIYDPQVNTCQLLPNSVCNTSIQSQKCVSTTQCIYSPEFATVVCRCPGVSIPSKIVSTLCVLNHNDPCAEGSKFDLCDPYSFLQCSNLGHCSCRGEKNKTHFDKDAEMCYLKAGQTCFMNDSLSQACTPNSMCVNENGNPTCVCKKSFQPNRNGQCFLPHLSHCSLSNDLCDAASFLKCDLQNKCTCGEDAEFNQFRDTCHFLTNASCVPTKIQPLGSQPCVPNAICSDLTKRCDCIDDLTSNVIRHCTLQHGATCDPVVDLCDKLSHLECNVQSRTCTCSGEKEQVAIFSKFQKKCYRLAESKCGNDYAQCIHNSNCDPIDKICVCNKSMKLLANKQGLCFLSFESTCDMKNNLCDPDAFLECAIGDLTNSSLCKCQREYETFYDHNDKSCRLIHDRPCVSSPIIAFERIQLCDNNAICEPSAAGNKTYRCHCKPGFTPNSEKLCFIPHEADCNNHPTECDPYGHLACRVNKELGKNNQCFCLTDKMYFSPEIQQCLTFPGELCEAYPTSQKCRENAYCGTHNVCECLQGFEQTHDAHCLLQYRGTCGDKENSTARCNDRVNLKCRAGFCLCEEGYLEHHFLTIGGINKTVCLPGYNTTCQELHDPSLENLLCHPGAFLACSNEVCRCENEMEQVFVASRNQCLQTVGMSCNNITELCIPNAECAKSEVEERGKCICDVNSTVSWGYPKLCVKNSASTPFLHTFMFIFTVLVAQV